MDLTEWLTIETLILPAVFGHITFDMLDLTQDSLSDEPLQFDLRGILQHVAMEFTEQGDSLFLYADSVIFRPNILEFADDELLTAKDSFLYASYFELSIGENESGLSSEDRKESNEQPFIVSYRFRFGKTSLPYAKTLTNTVITARYRATIFDSFPNESVKRFEGCFVSTFVFVDSVVRSVETSEIPCDSLVIGDTANWFSK